MGESLKISSNNAVNGVALNTEQHCLNNGDVDDCISLMPSDDMLMIKKMDASDDRNDTDTGENDKPAASPSIAASPSVNSDSNEYKDDLNLELRICDNNDARTNSSHDIQSDASYSLDDRQQANIVSDSGCKDGSTDEHCLDHLTSDHNCTVTTSRCCTEILNSATDIGDTESQCTVQDDSNSSQKPRSHAASDAESAISDLENLEAKELPTAKFDEKHSTDVVVGSQLQLECEGDEVRTLSVNAGSEKRDGPLTYSAAVEDSKSSPSLSTSQVSAANVAASSVTSLPTVSTVVISTPLISSLSISGLPAKVAVLSVASSSGVTRPTQQSNKPLVVSLPSATVCSSSSTRLMSKLLQDVGLLLVSQKVFKNLASIQKQKIGNSQKKCDKDLLQKLKTSHQNLVAKNRGLLTVDRKCWCGFRSESLNVIEAHCLKCDFQGRCCYCRGEFVYRTQKQMKQHLWKIHRKVGHMVDRVGSLQCAFCPVTFSSRFSLIRHVELCRQKFSLVSNLAPREYDKDIPVTAASKQPVKIPVMVSSAQISPVTVPPTSSRSTSVSSAKLISPTIVSPAVSMQLAPVARKPGPVAQLLQIGKQLFTLLPSTTVASPVIAVNQSPAVKCVSKLALNSAIQTAQNANSALPIIFSNKGTNQEVSQATTVPASVLPCSLQYSVCPVCSAFVKDKTALLVHMRIAHGSSHKMCQYCCSADITFPSISELQSHIAEFHTSDCWMCKTRCQPPHLLISHIADRHRVSMCKMLELRRCYLCSAVPTLPNYTEFEEHMMKLHSRQFCDTGKLWNCIVNSPDADRSWYAKQNADGTLECPLCLGQFISTSFLYRHLHLEHNGNVVRLVQCPECGKHMPSNILLVHLTDAHTRKCSVKLYQADVSEYGCIFVPPVGTKRINNNKGRPMSGSHPLKRLKTAETVVISDDESNSEGYSDSEGYNDDSSDEDFVLSTRINIQPKQRLRRSIHTRVDRRASSVDDVHEVLESIVDSSESETIPKRFAGFTNTSTCLAAVGPSADAQLCNGITEDEVEIIESIVPTIRDRHQRPVSKPERIKSSDRNRTTHDLTADAKTTNSKPVVVHTASDKSNIELTEYNDRDCRQSSTKSKPSLSESSAQQLMSRDQIMMNSVEEVLEIDGETVLIVHDEGDEEEEDD